MLVARDLVIAVPSPSTRDFAFSDVSALSLTLLRSLWAAVCLLPTYVGGLRWNPALWEHCAGAVLRLFAPCNFQGLCLPFVFSHRVVAQAVVSSLLLPYLHFHKSNASVHVTV